MDNAAEYGHWVVEEKAKNIFRNNFNTVEQQHIKEDCARCEFTADFIKQRQALELQTGRKEAKLHHSRGYTDDVFILAIGLERMYRVKKVIYHTIGKGGAGVMIAPKTKIGTSLHLIGVAWLLAFGMPTVTHDKKQKVS